MRFKTAGTIWRAPYRPDRDESAAYRAITGPEGSLTLLLADGSETGWDLGFNEISKAALDRAQRAIEGIDPQGPAGSWLPMFRAVSEVVAENQSSEEEFSASATLLCVRVENGRAHAAWIAPHEAFLVRDGKVIERTVGHSIGREIEEAGTPAASARGAQTAIATRSITDNPSELEPGSLAAPWSLNSGDRVVLCTAHLLQTIQPNDIGTRATSTPLADFPAALVGLAEERVRRALGNYDENDPFRRHDADRFFSMLMHCAAVVVAEVV